MEKLFKRLPTITLRERVLESVADAILTGELKPGQRIVERELCEQFGASSTVIREALIELETNGYVTKRTNAATLVTNLSMEDARKIMDVRALLEPHAAALAAAAATSEELQELRNVYAELVRIASVDDTKGYVRADLRLHEAIWILSGNEYLVSVLKRLMFPLFAFAGMLIMAHHSVDIAADARGHLSVLEPIFARNPRAARAAMEAAVRAWSQETEDRVFAAAATAAKSE